MTPRSRRYLRNIVKFQDRQTGQTINGRYYPKTNTIRLKIPSRITDGTFGIVTDMSSLLK